MKAEWYASILERDASRLVNKIATVWHTTIHGAYGIIDSVDKERIVNIEMFLTGPCNQATF